MLAQLKPAPTRSSTSASWTATRSSCRSSATCSSAWDDGRKQGLGGKADDPTSGEVSASTAPSATASAASPSSARSRSSRRTATATYSTYNCLDSTEIPMTVTDADGIGRRRREGTVNQCDKPAVHLLAVRGRPARRDAARTSRARAGRCSCRKSIGGYASNQYNDIAMIGHNPFTGKTCFFQNALYSKTDGGNVPHPADKDEVGRTCGAACTAGSARASSARTATTPIRSSTRRGSTARRTRRAARSSRRWASTRTSRSARTTRRTRSSTSHGQGWTMEKQLVSAEANACLKCHRMGWRPLDRVADLTRLDGTDSSWTDITTATFNEAPRTSTGCRPMHAFDDRRRLDSSDVREGARRSSRSAARTRRDPACIWKDVPTTLGGDAERHGSCATRSACPTTSSRSRRRRSSA